MNFGLFLQVKNIECQLLGEEYLVISIYGQQGFEIKDNFAVFQIDAVDIGLEICQEMLENLELNVSFVVGKSHMRRRFKNNQGHHQLDRAVLQFLANPGGEIVNISPLRWNCDPI